MGSFAVLVRPLTQQTSLTLLNRSLAAGTVLVASMVGAVLLFGARNSNQDAYVPHSLEVRSVLDEPV